MVSLCVKTGADFGVVGITKGSDVMQPGENVAFAEVGTIARIVDFDVPQAGLMNIRCVGTYRFRIHRCEQRKDGLWVGDVETIADDQLMPLQPDLQKPVEALGELIAVLKTQGISEQEQGIFEIDQGNLDAVADVCFGPKADLRPYLRMCGRPPSNMYVHHE